MMNTSIESKSGESVCACACLWAVIEVLRISSIDVVCSFPYLVKHLVHEAY